MLKNIIRNEWRTMLAERSLPFIAVFLSLLVGYGVYNGSARTSLMGESLTATDTEYSKRMAKLRANLLGYESGALTPRGASDPRSAAFIGGTSAVPYLVMPPGPLAALAVGQSDLYPYYYKVSLRSKYLVFSNDEIENPANLLAGRFDVAFVIVYLYPLLILALSYNLLSSEKEQGTLAMTLANPIELRTLMLGKTLARGGALAGLSLAILLVAVLFAGIDWRMADRVFLWALVMLIYGAFWFILAVGVNALGRHSATNALMLAGFWLCFVLIIPSLLNLISSALYPIPSRVEMIQAMRNAGKAAQRKGSQSLARYLEDHPELAPAGGVRPDFASLSTAAQIEVDRSIQPILDRYEQQITSQQGIVDRFCYLSPAVLAYQALTDLAGTGAGAYRNFNRQADRFLQSWQNYFFPRVFARKVLTASELSDFPRYRYGAESWSLVMSRVGMNCFGILVPTVLLFAWAIRQLSRYRLAG